MTPRSPRGGGSVRTKLVIGMAAGFGSWWALNRLARARRRIDLRGRTALVTGGSRGLGLAIAREFMSQGANVAICARDEKELKLAEKDLAARGRGRVQTIVCDLTKPDEIKSMVSDVESHFGGIDMLVNNAGTILVGPESVMHAEDYEHAMAVNFWAAVYTVQAALPAMRSRGNGRIVNIGSVGGKMPVPHLLPYCASKFALVGFSTGLRAELAADGILVSTINPGLMNTGSPRNAGFKGKHQAEYAWFSISDALPGLSMSAATAARRIVDAAVHGDAEVTIGLPAKIGATLYALAPSAFAEVSSLFSKLLPSAPEGGSSTKPGRESESIATRSFLRDRGHSAEQDYNQLND